MKKYIVFLFTVVTLLLPQAVGAQSAATRYEAEIIELRPDKVAVQIMTGDQKDKRYEVMLFDQKQVGSQRLQKGDRVLVSLLPARNGKQSVIIEDHVRTVPLAVLVGIFLLIVFVIGKWKGLLSTFAMVLSFFVIARFILPQILLGNDPLLISLLGALFIIPMTFYIAHGVRRQTTVAVIGTFLALIVTGALSYFFVIYAKLTGFAAEEATFIQTMVGTHINMQSLLLAGIIIGAMGVLDDITISQTTIVQKLIKANPKYTFWKLYREAMDVGRDHIASLVNTLVLVYAGAALPLFILFSSSQLGNFSQVVNMEIVSTEVVRTLVSSIGIITAVPITTFIAAKYLKKHA